MRILALLVGLFFGLGVALDAFQTIILPRRPAGRLRITRLFYIFTWTPWKWIADRIPNRRFREQFFSIYGPLSLLLLLVLWALLLLLGFALLYFALGSPFADHLNPHGSLEGNLRMDLYVSATTLLSLGIVDVTPLSHIARALIALESGTGLGFVALVIGYVPVLYQAFSRREVSVALLDGRAGSPPTATELLRRHGFDGGEAALIQLLGEWERWAAEILESHISYPLLCYYRSQHDNQSWLSALTAILDACALIITTVEGVTTRQAQLTFAMSRHALVDLGHVFHLEKKAEVDLVTEADDRLQPAVFNHLCDALGEIEMRLCGDPDSMARLTKIRRLYEPHAQALSEYLRMPLPLWVAPPRADGKSDQWKTVADLRRNAGLPPRTIHISDQAVAVHLHDDEPGF